MIDCDITKANLQEKPLSNSSSPQPFKKMMEKSSSHHKAKKTSLSSALPQEPLKARAMGEARDFYKTKKPKNSPKDNHSPTALPSFFQLLAQENDHATPFPTTHPKEKLTTPSIEEASDCHKTKKIESSAKETSAIVSLPSFSPLISQENAHGTAAPKKTFFLSSIHPQKQLAALIANYVVAERPDGVTTTTAKIKTADPFSPFNGTEVEIKEYDTHPKSFVVKLSSSPEAKEILNAQLASLQIALEKTLPHFTLHFSPPSLLLTGKKKIFSSSHKKRSTKKKSTVFTSLSTESAL